VHINTATVTRHAGWTSQTGAIGRRESNRCFKQAIHNYGHTRFDMAGVASSTDETTRQTASAWAHVEPAKLYHGVGLSDSDPGIAEVMPPAYFG